MKIESHLESLQESVTEIEAAVISGLVSKQRTVGIHTSAGAIDMLEIILHQHNLIDPGAVIKHEWFSSSQGIRKRFSFDFPRKEEIISLMESIEAVRNKLCYGKRQDEKILIKVVEEFNKLHSIFREVSGYEL
ncbi:hypothetical protein HZC30_01340 [Candidatus Woesearchaeota archaeon]|nr:hypothetical protein [Candidatus Woesearchaeota archaeon]